MLVLSRKIGESIHIGNDIIVTILENNRGQVRIGLEAPKTVNIVRAELIGRETNCVGGIEVDSNTVALDRASQQPHMSFRKPLQQFEVSPR